MAKHQLDGETSFTEFQGQSNDLIDLGIGRPDDMLLPLAELREATRHRFSLIDRTYLQYAPEAGHPSLRKQLADFLTHHYGATVLSERLFLTAGASQGLDLISQYFVKPGDTVFVEDPTYFLALRILREKNLRIVPIPIDAEGIDVAALEDLLKIEKPAFLYTIPTHHNPTSITLSSERRRKLVRLARKYGFFVVADEVYQLLNYEGNVPARLAAFDDNQVISLGSFSKILSPGVRLGWIEAAPEYISTLSRSGVIQSGGGVNPFASAIVESAIELGLQNTYLNYIREIYRQRCVHMLRVLDQVLPRTVTFTRPKGGFFVWLELPNYIDSNKLLAEAHAFKIGFRPGTLFSQKATFMNFLRLCFTHYNESQIERACEQLGRLLSTACYHS